jgi:RNA polymerase sigma factor (sigma-70 family)
MTSTAIDVEPTAAPSAQPVRSNRQRHSDGSRDACDVGTLIRAAAGGDQNAWNQLVDEFASTVWAIARGHRLNSADAADVFQTTWLRLLEHLGRIEQPERVGAWIATTARRECLRLLRTSRRQVPRDDFDFVPDPVTFAPPDRNLVLEERRHLVSELVDQLPSRSRLLLRLLSADSPLSYKEISAALSMPIGSIGPSRQRALEQLRKMVLRAGLNSEDVFAF